MNKKISIGQKFVIISLLLAGCEQEFDSSLAPSKSNLVPGGNTAGVPFLEPMVDPISSLPVYKTGAVAFSIADKYAYVGTGYIIDPVTGVLKPSNDLWQYDPLNDRWTQVASLPGEPRVFASAFSIGTKGYVGTGASNIAKLKDFWEYDHHANSWTRKADFDGESRIGATGFSIGNAGYIGTGTSDHIYEQQDFWRYNPVTDTWSRIANLPGKRRLFAGSFVINNIAYVGAGYLQNSPLRDFWKYNPITETWEQAASLSEDSMPGHSGFFSVRNMGYAGGNQQLWRYNPELDSWSKIAVFPGTMHNGVGFSLLGEYGYIGTGSHPDNAFGGNLFYRYSL